MSLPPHIKICHYKFVLSFRSSYNHRIFTLFVFDFFPCIFEIHPCCVSFVLLLSFSSNSLCEIPFLAIFDSSMKTFCENILISLRDTLNSYISGSYGVCLFNYLIFYKWLLLGPGIVPYLQINGSLLLSIVQQTT